MIFQAVGLSVLLQQCELCIQKLREITEVESEKESKVEPDQEKTISKITSKVFKKCYNGLFSL